MQRQQVLALADAIEDAMRAIGMSSSTGSFDAWLLERYLPGLRGEGPLPKPEDVYDRALRAWCASGPEEDGPKRVLDLLFRLDRALLLGVAVKRLGFFEEGVAEEKGTVSSYEGRPLERRFARASTRYVMWQIELEHPDARDANVDLVIDWEVILTNKERFASGVMELTIQKEWKTSYLSKGWGWESPGNWMLGEHTLTMRLWRQPFAQATFEIY